MSIAGCDRVPGTQANLERQARAVLADTLFDADSAKLRATRAVRNGRDDMICGEVNAKNRMGAFVGFHRFIVVPEARDAFVDPQADGNASQEQRNYQAGWDNIKSACWR